MSRYVSVVELNPKVGELMVVTLEDAGDKFKDRVVTQRGGLMVTHNYGDQLTPGRTRVDIGENLTIQSQEGVDVWGDNGKGGIAAFIEAGGTLELRAKSEHVNLSSVVIRRKVLED